MDSSLSDYSQQWDVEEKNNEGFPVSFTVPHPNWSAKQLAYYIDQGSSWTYATQTIGIPFMSLSLLFHEEAYTSGVAIYLLLFCWSAAILTACCFREWPNACWIGVAAVFVSLGSPGFSLALKHAIPALYTSGTVFFLLALLFSHARNQNPTLPILTFAISFTMCILMYLPALLITGPLWIYGFTLLAGINFRKTVLQLLIILILILILGNIELQRPIKLIITNTTGSLVDYGIDWTMIPSCLFGVADFETILSAPQHMWIVRNLTVACIVSGIIFSLLSLHIRGRIIFTLFLIPFLFAISYYMYKVGHYHVIRMTEFAAPFLLSIAGIGLIQSVHNQLQNKTYYRFSSLIVYAAAILLFYDFTGFKVHIFQTVLQPHSEPRASTIDSNALALCRDIVPRIDEVTIGDKTSICYWMNWGAIQSANNEIIFRNVPYLEGFEFDYSNRNLDLLSLENTQNALLIYPKPLRTDILYHPASFMSPPRWNDANYCIWYTGTGRGAVLIGTGWLPPRREGTQTIRFLRGAIEGGLLIWCDRPQQIALSMKAYSTGEPQLLSLHFENPSPDPKDYPKYIRQVDETLHHFTERLQSYFYPYEVDILHEMRMTAPIESLTWSEFNQLLVRQRYFQNILRYYYESPENTDKITGPTRQSFQDNRFDVPLKLWGTNETSPLLVLMNLESGVNLIRLVARHQDGTRGGRNPIIEIGPYSTKNPPYDLIFSNISIIPLDDPVDFMGRIHQVEQTKMPIALREALRREGYFAETIGPHPTSITVLQETVHPGGSVTIEWRGLDRPEQDDWIGLFPIGAPDRSRITHVFTQGKTEGRLEFTIPDSVSAGQYEFRLYRHGTWAIVNVSNLVDVQPATNDF